jgi:DNA-directed RNA polymerase specialized sigma24 family protein
VSAPADRRARAEEMATRLYAESHGHLLGVARRHAANDDDAEEALQESFLIFIEKADPDALPNPIGWLTLVLKRECWARRRRMLRTTVGQEADPGLGEVGFVLDDFEHPGRGPDELAELGGRVRLTRELLAQLKPDERRALSLKALGYSYTEIGELTGWTYTKINRCMAEGNARLRELGAPDGKQQ